MRLLPANGVEWADVTLVPFKTYPIVVFCIAIVWSSELRGEPIDFGSYRSNAVVLTRLSLDTMAGLYAGEAGVNYNVQASPGIPTSWGPHLSITTDAEGLAHWTETNSAPRRFFRVERP